MVKQTIEEKKEKDKKYSREWRKKNPEKIKAYLERNSKRIIRKRKEYYDENRKKLIANLKKREQRTGYARYKTGQEGENQKIRALTRSRYLLKGKTCQFCDRPAKHRHHTTKPLQADKFIFLCEKHHNEIHGKRCVSSGLDDGGKR